MMKNHLITTLAAGVLLLCSLSLKSQNKNAAPKPGKYGCTSSQYSGGYYQYTPKGSFTLKKDGSYTYSGFQKPSSGKYTVDEQGNLHFKGGYLDGGEAEKIDRPNKFFLVFPTIPDNRWTCGLTAE